MLKPNRATRRRADKAARCIRRCTKVPGPIVQVLGRKFLRELEQRILQDQLARANKDPGFVETLTHRALIRLGDYAESLVVAAAA